MRKANVAKPDRFDADFKRRGGSRLVSAFPFSNSVPQAVGFADPWAIVGYNSFYDEDTD